jgi:hypothetical protein
MEESIDIKKTQYTPEIKRNIYSELIKVSDSFNIISNLLQSLCSFMDESLVLPKNKRENNHLFQNSIHNIKINQETNSRVKKKFKRRDISCKLYSVQTLQDGEIKKGYRIFCKYLKISLCFGPYSNYDFALELRKNLQNNLKLFNYKIPGVEKLINVFLLEVKKRIDSIHPPAIMVRKTTNKVNIY